MSVHDQKEDAAVFLARPGQFPIVGVGASAGGLEAFTQLLSALEPNTGMGFVLVQHLGPQHESALAQILSRATSLPVCEIENDQVVEANHVYVIPGGMSLSIDRGVLKLSPRSGRVEPHRPIDSFFKSLAADKGERAIGILFSGTGNDGTLGLEAIKADGGITFAQDESAKYDSMPRSAIASGSVDLVLSPSGIAEELARIAKHPLIAGQPLELSREAEAARAGGRQGAVDHGKATTHDETFASGGVAEDECYKRILLLLRDHSGVDFSSYRSTTIKRRILRRLLLCKQESLESYANFVKQSVKELDALYEDLLISVTAFFRNPATFEALQHNVIPALLKVRTDAPARCWVPGCSTGQEAYSIAMAYVDAAQNAPNMRRLQLFATDLNESLLEKARQGLYAKNLVENISPQRLSHFFVEEQGGYRVTKALRHMVTFSRHNLISDPPFSRIDLISCRNLLIYFDRDLQKKTLLTFHYALRPGGYLLLGSSETIGEIPELFESVDKRLKIYCKTAAQKTSVYPPVSRTPDAPSDVQGKSEPSLPTKPEALEPGQFERVQKELSPEREADRIVVNQFAPPAVLINAKNQIIQFRGPISDYLQLPAGKANFDVLKMAREGLMLPLRAAIQEAAVANRTVRQDGVRIEQSAETGEPCIVDLEVIPLRNLAEQSFLVMFKNPGPGQNAAARQPVRQTLSKAEEESRVLVLEREISEIRESFRSMEDQHETASEALQYFGEEAQSANEELQSVNEELETSKEELESANEELNTLNDELSNRNVELNHLNNDLVNVQTSALLNIILLGRDLSIRRFSPQAELQFGLSATDVGRSIGHIRHNLSLVRPATRESSASPSGSDPGSKPHVLELDLERMVSEVIASVQEQDLEVQDQAGGWHQLRVRPYLTVDNEVDGAVLVLTDIDQIKLAEQAIATARDYAENTLATVRHPLLILDPDLRVESANRSFYRVFHVTPQQTIGRPFREVGHGQWDNSQLRRLLTELIPHNTTVEDFELEHDVKNVGPKLMMLNARRIVDPQERSDRILLAFEDITERRRLEDTLRETRARNRSLEKEVNELCLRAGSVAPYALEIESRQGDPGGPSTTPQEDVAPEH